MMLDLFHGGEVCGLRYVGIYGRTDNCLFGSWQSMELAFMHSSLHILEGEAQMWSKEKLIELEK